jgi:hypothetical protein
MEWCVPGGLYKLSVKVLSVKGVDGKAIYRKESK